MPIAQRRHFVFQALQCALNVLVGVGRQGFLQVLGDAVVVHHDAAALAEPRAVHAGNGLQQLRLADRAVEVHHAFNRRIEAGQQHRLHDQESQRIGLLSLGVEQRLLESLDPRLVGRSVRPLFPGRIVVVAAGNHRCELDVLQRVAVAPGLHDGLHLGRPLAQRLVVQRLVFRRQRVSLGEQFGARGFKRSHVTHRRQAAVGHHLRLVAVGQDVGHIVAQHVARLVRDQQRGVEDRALGGVLLLDRLQFLCTAIAEQVLKQLVQAGPVFDRTLRGAPLVQHGHGRAVFLGLFDRVAVDELAEDLVGALLVTHDDRRAGKADARAVGQPGQQVGVQVTRLGSVRLIDEHEDGVVLVQHFERLRRRLGHIGRRSRLLHTQLPVLPAVRDVVLGQTRLTGGIRVTVLLDRGEQQPGALAAHQLLYGHRRRGHLHHFAGQRCGGAELVLQVFAVGHHHHFEAAQGGVRAQLAHQEHHGQRLARALGVPDHATAPVVLAILQASLAALQALNRLVHGAELLIPACHLDGLPTGLHEQGEVAHDVQQVRLVEHARHHPLLLGQCGNPQAGGNIFFARRGRGLPAGKVLEQAADRAHARLVEAGRDQQLVGEEQRLVALVVFHLVVGVPLVAVAAQLVDSITQRLRDGWALALHHHQWNAVHQQHQVRHDEGLAAVVARRAIHPELVDDRKAVVLGRVPVDEADGLATPTIPTRQAVDSDAQQ